MNKYGFMRLTFLVVFATACLFWGLTQPVAAKQKAADTQTSVAMQASADTQVAIKEAKKSAHQKRQEANKRLQDALDAGQPEQIQAALNASQSQQTTQPAVAAPLAAPLAPAPMAPAAAPLAPAAPAITYPTGINPAVNIALPNWANSPNIRKFMDSLPGLGAANANNLGQYIPIAVPNTTMYPGSDYYEIGLKDYNEQMHSDLPPTQIRGYYQMNTTDPCVAAPHYLGPIIIAKRDRAVRLKFTNQLGIGAAGNLALPVDTTVMGAGMGAILNPDGTLPTAMPMPMAPYTQNRATIHLHGGLTPWISDGTPHQWITPAGDPTVQKKGASFQNVPDMIGAGKSIPTPSAGDGLGTYYYTNQQSARLMFYHDHAYGITRLNVYAGEAAGYLITDPVEDDLIDGNNVTGANPTNAKVLPNLGGAYRYGIPLVIQDKTFVNDANTPSAAAQAAFPAGYTPTLKTADVDPLWYNYVTAAGKKGGALWIGHEYMPNENIYDPTGFNVMGRWDYGPWMIPPMLALNNTLPSPTIIPEAFMDTPVVNGCAFPYVTLPPTAVRFRILNACNDRMLNLQLYKADPCHPTEVKMVPATPNPAYPTWPRDGRDGGVPDPTTQGPTIYQIGNEGGFLAQVAETPPQPVDFDYNRRSVTFGGVTSKSLLLPPAVRADIIVDLSAYAGQTLILYNDAPAPMPLYDTRYDYFTDCPDQTAIGGAPSIPPGFGPNIRTVMQIRVQATAASPAYDVNTLKAVLPKAFAVAQPKPLVPELAYNDAYPGLATGDIYANAASETLNITGTTQSVATVMTGLPGLGYTTPPTVSFFGGGVAGGTPGTAGNPGVAATAVASLNGITGITLITAGTGYTSTPTITIGLPNVAGGIRATAAATVSGGVVTVVSITNPGSGYTIAPTVTFTGGGATAANQATAQAAITLGTVGAITLTNAGSGYVRAPLVYLTGGGGTGADAIAMLNGDKVLTGKNLVEGMDMQFGRMNAVLGSTPNPLAPTVGAGPVIGAAGYVDPPTEILNDGETILWRISHIGVDSHAIHFHLFDLQVVNRVDWTNTIKPPYPEELGWKETIRTNPFEDIIVAIRPKSMILPFTIPNSNRLLDPTGMAMFLPVAPPIGIPAVAQTTNVMTNFGWEYVWHCHLLGHEENDMMRPMSLIVTAPTRPTNLTAASGVQGTQLVVNLAWVDNAINTTQFEIQRAGNTNFTGAVSFTVSGDAKTYIDTSVALSTQYYYRVRAVNGAGNSAWSTTASILTPGGPPPAAPTNAAAAMSTTPPLTVTVTWTDNSNNETGFTIQRSTSATFGTVTTYTVGANVTSFVNTGTFSMNTTYYYRVAAANGGNLSTWSVAPSVRVAPAAAPTGLTATPSLPTANPLTITLNWTDNSSVEAGYIIQRATNSGFSGATSFSVGANVVTYIDNTVAANTVYYYRVAAFNGTGTSAWSNTASTSITSPPAATFIVDNGQAGTSSTGSWLASGAAGSYGTTSVYGWGGATYTWSFTPTVTATYRVSVWYTIAGSRYTAVPYAVTNAGATANFTLNQTTNGSTWNVLGQFPMNAGTTYTVTVTAVPATSPPSTSADAVRWEQL